MSYQTCVFCKKCKKKTGSKENSCNDYDPNRTTECTNFIPSNMDTHPFRICVNCILQRTCGKYEEFSTKICKNYLSKPMNVFISDDTKARMGWEKFEDNSLHYLPAKEENGFNGIVKGHIARTIVQEQD